MFSAENHVSKHMEESESVDIVCDSGEYDEEKELENLKQFIRCELESGRPFPLDLVASESICDMESVDSHEDDPEAENGTAQNSDAPVTYVFLGEQAHFCPLPECEQIFINEFGLRRHVKKHEDTSQFICYKCCEIFSTKEGRNSHRKQMHKPVFKLFCASCGFSFRKNTTYALHFTLSEECTSEYHKLKDADSPCQD